MIRARCDKTIRRAARARVFSSETWTRQYKTARGGWQYYVLLALGITFLPIFGVLLLIVFPAFAGGVLAAEQGGMGSLVSVIAALLSFVVAIGHASWLIQELVSSRSLAVVSQLPMSDRQFLANRSGFSLRLTLVFLFVAVSFFVAAAVVFKMGLAKSALIVTLALLQWGLVASLSLIVPAWFPRMARSESIGGIVSLGFMVVVACVTLAQMNVVQLESARMICLMVLPTGWVFLLLELGILEELAVAAWLLVPSALIMAFGVRAHFRLKARYRPWEVTIDSESVARATFEAPEEEPEESDSTDPRAEADPAFVSDPAAEERLARKKRITGFLRDWVGLPDKPEEIELPRGEATDRVRSREFLEPYSWPTGGLMERLVGSILTEREQRVAALMCGGEPEWSRRIVMDMSLGCLAMAVIALAQQLLGMKVLMLSWHVGLFVLFVGLRRSWPGMVLRSSTGHLASIMGFLPVTHRELNRIVMVLGAVRALVYAPFAVAVSVAGVAGLRGRFDWVLAAYIASKAVLMVVAIHQWWFIGLQPHQSSRSILAQIGEALLFIPVMLLAIGGAGGMLLSGKDELWSMGGAALMFGAGWFAQRWQRKRVLTGPIDFVTIRQNELQQQMQAQRRREPTASW